MSSSPAGDGPARVPDGGGPAPTAVTVIVAVTDDSMAVEERGAVTESGAVGEPFGPERWRRLVHAVLVDEGVSGALDVTFVGEADMARLNAEHMGQEGPTDVLAFPIDGEADDAALVGAEVPRLLGDVVICPAVARSNAAENAGADHDGTAEDEIALLVVHGVLHVLGWDHATDDQRRAMQARERHHLDRWRSAGPQPEQVTAP